MHECSEDEEAVLREIQPANKNCPFLECNEILCDFLRYAQDYVATYYIYFTL